MDHGTKLKSISFDLCSHISKQLVSSVVSMYFSFLSLSLPLFLILSGQGRVRDTFSHESQIIGGLWRGRERIRVETWKGLIITLCSKTGVMED